MDLLFRYFCLPFFCLTSLCPRTMPACVYGAIVHIHLSFGRHAPKAFCNARRLQVPGLNAELFIGTKQEKCSHPRTQLRDLIMLFGAESQKCR